MTALVIICVVQSIVFPSLIAWIVQGSAQERSELTRRLIALTSVETAQVLDNVENVIPIKPVRYVDEEGMNDGS